MINITKIFRKLRRLITRLWNFYDLRHNENRITKSITHSIQETMKSLLIPEEKKWIDRIESLRTQMNASTKPLTRMDYGSGNPDSNRTKEEMQAGIEIKDTLGHISQIASKSAFWCCFLFKLVRNISPNSCIEMGTAVGISAAYQAAALKINGHGIFVSLEGANSIADVARNNFQQLGLDNLEVVVGRFQDTLPNVLEKCQPVDYVFVDGHHDEQATIGYFEQIIPFLAEKALIILDDIAWSEGMKRAWNAIARDSRVGIAIDLGPVGLCVIDRSIPKYRYFNIPLH